MNRFSFIVLLALIFAADYALAQIPSCPCDTLELSNAITGNDIVELLCPGGETGEDTEYLLVQAGVIISTLNPPPTGYQVIQLSNVGDYGCGIFQGDNNGDGMQISEQEFEDCKTSLIERCNLQQINPIPTLSEWGMIVMAVALGIVGLYIAARKRKATV